VLGFRFDYPVAMVSEAGPRTSLHYYVYSNRLFFDAMQLDACGIPLQCSRTLGTFYNPAFVAWYGLMAMERYTRGDSTGLDIFKLQSEWLIRNAVHRSDGSIVWPFPVDVREGKCTLKAPWASAMIQGLAISALVRARRLGWESKAVIPLCKAATNVYRLDVADGGVRSRERGWVLYEEYPGYPSARILDGFLFSLLGLYDLWVETEEPEVGRLFEEGIAGLVHNIQHWNYKDKWTWYGSHSYLCPPHYHKLNRMLLAAIAHLTGEIALHRAVELWDPTRLTRADRAYLYMTFLCLKNASRARAFLSSK
jgi:hypothetical protein